MKIGYIGLGELGGNLARCLHRGGHELRVFDLDKVRLATFGDMAANSVAEVAGFADVVFTCLPNPNACAKVVDEIVKAAKPGTIWIENSTLSREDILKLAGLAQNAGLRVLEAPVTGGVHLAVRGEVAVLVGGELTLMEECRPLLDLIGNRIFHMGPHGTAAIIKVITNMLAFIHLVADAEAMMLAKKGGLDLAQSWRAIQASSGNSFVHETEGQLILNGSYDVGFNMDLALKDLGFAMQFGKEFGVPLELASITNQTYIRGKAAYGGNAQSPQIAKLLEDALGTDLRAEGFPARLV